MRYTVLMIILTRTRIMMIIAAASVWPPGPGRVPPQLSRVAAPRSESESEQSRVTSHGPGDPGQARPVRRRRRRAAARRGAPAAVRGKVTVTRTVTSHGDHDCRGRSEPGPGSGSDLLSKPESRDRAGNL